MNAPDESVVHGSKARPQDLPALDKLLRDCASLVAEQGHTLVAQEARALLVGLRTRAVAGELLRSEVDALPQALAARVHARMQPAMRAVLNLTGTVIHTNLGRSLLADAALQQVLALMGSPNNLEFDLEAGARGDRDDLIEGLLCELTGAEAATVVNNNAAAVLLGIAALAGGKEAIVSRGELVEIGGAFRMPDVMSAAGATLVEVGTTNRTHPRDYEQAITPRTGLIVCAAGGAQAVSSSAAPASGRKSFGGMPCQDCLAAAMAAIAAPHLAFQPVAYAAARVEHAAPAVALAPRARAPPRPPGHGPPTA